MTEEQELFNTESDESLEGPLKLAWMLLLYWFQMRVGFDPKAPWRQKLRRDMRVKKPLIFFYHLNSTNETGLIMGTDRIVKPFKLYPDDNAIIFDVITEKRETPKGVGNPIGYGGDLMEGGY